MCLVHAKEDEYYCCGSTTAFVDYCNICPEGITAGDDFRPWSSDNFSPWSSGSTCYDLVQNAKIYENGSVGCNHYKGYELSCCPGACNADSESTPVTPPSTTSIPDISPPISSSFETSMRPPLLRHLSTYYVLWKLLQQLLDQLWLW
jgi:hypothetical protein